MKIDFKKVKNLRGLFYRKVSEAAAKQEDIIPPGFDVKKPTRLIEFPDAKDPTTINITYSLIEPFAYANIKWDPVSKEIIYNVIEPQLNENEAQLLIKISDGLIELVEVELTAIKDPAKVIEYLQKNVAKIIREYGLTLSAALYVKIMYYIYRNFVGFNEIEALLQDPNIEDISCDGVGTPFYIIHRKYGSLKINTGFKKLDDLREFIIKLAERCGRYVSYAEPILAGTLADGSRVSATLASDVATHGPTFTIRKFSENPLSPIEQLDLGTVSTEVLAYFWYLVEHGASMLVVGGVATGKTSFLNSISMFIPPEAKIVSIEDTRELRLPHGHWIPGLARVGFGIPMPTGEKYGEVTLFDLLKESFRQNPDYVIVGEVRGKEAYVMFQGMSSGHPCLSTFHAGSVETVIKRLTTPPIELSPTLIESLDVIAIMVHAKEKGKSARRIKEIAEIESVDPKTQEVKSVPIFRWDPLTDTFEKTGDSIKLRRIVATTGGDINDAIAEIDKRKRILDWFESQNIKGYAAFSEMINLYYKEPNKLMEKMGASHEELLSPKFSVKPEITKPVPQIPVPVAIPKQLQIPITEMKKGEHVSLLSLLGFKLIEEK